MTEQPAVCPAQHDVTPNDDGETASLICCLPAGHLGSHFDNIDRVLWLDPGPEMAALLLAAVSEVKTRAHVTVSPRSPMPTPAAGS